MAPWLTVGEGSAKPDIGVQFPAGSFKLWIKKGEFQR